MAFSNHDVVLDSPLLNLATLNPLDTSGGTISNNNLSYQANYINGRNGNGVPSTVVIPSSGKWYLECNTTVFSGGGNSGLIGITSWQGSAKADAWFGGSSDFEFYGVDAATFNNTLWARFRDENGVLSTASTQVTVSSTYGSGDTVMIAYDLDGITKKMWVGYKGTWYNNGDPATGTNPTYTFTSSADSWKFWAESVASGNNSNRSAINIDFGQGFQYQIPAGYKMVAANNLPEGPIKLSQDQTPSDNFKAFKYSGVPNTTTLRNIGFRPDLVWIHMRNDSINRDHEIVDSVRGSAAGPLASNNNGKGDGIERITFDDNGFNTFGTYGNTNLNTSTNYVAWCWKAAGAPADNQAKIINEDGTQADTTCAALATAASASITPSKVSANRQNGFSIVKYNGTGTSDNVNYNIPHGLSYAPDVVIVKNLDLGSQSSGISWPVLFTNIGGLQGLDGTGGVVGGELSNNWGGSYPNVNTFFVRRPSVSSTTNRYRTMGAYNYIAYCWHSVAGYSKFGSYVGNGSADGPFVHCGFRPAWVMVKNTSTSGSGHSSWMIFDTARQPFNVSLANNRLEADTSNAEDGDGRTGSGGNGIDFLSNGFKIRAGNWYDTNHSGSTYIFMAFAEQPFSGPSNAR